MIKLLPTALYRHIIIDLYKRLPEKVNFQVKYSQSMKKMSCTGTRSALTIVFALIMVIRVTGQNTLPDVLLQGTLNDQLNYLQEKTRIYEGYRAIREDMFQIVKKNSADSLIGAKKDIILLKKYSSTQNDSIDSLKNILAGVRQELAAMTSTKNSISLLGFEVNKAAYNATMWLIIALLAGCLSIGFIVFKRNHAVTIHTKKDLEELKKEFEAYRKASREAREKMSMAHFNELKRLRGA
jgi:hypothetical protein